MARKKSLLRKEPATSSSAEAENPLPAACPRCGDLERWYDDTVRHIRDVLETRFQGLREKVRELHRWQDTRDEAIEAFYAHKRTHRVQVWNARGRNVA